MAPSEAHQHRFAYTVDAIWQVSRRSKRLFAPALLSPPLQRTDEQDRTAALTLLHAAGSPPTVSRLTPIELTKATCKG
jgi:hypothetical protein